MIDDSKQELTDRCRLYLLDEMSIKDVIAFESQMASSPEILECLAIQAERLSELGEAVALVPVVTSPTAWQPASTARVASVLAAVAAMVLFVIWIGQTTQSSVISNGSFPQHRDARVASVWAETRTAFNNGEDEVDHESVSYASEIVVPAEVPSWLAFGVAQLRRDEETHDDAGGSNEKG